MAAIAALGVAKDMGIRVPGSLSILAWDDSPLCQVTQPALSVVRHDLYDYGARTARGILGVVEGSGIRPDPPVVTTLQPRGSTSVLHQQGHSDQLRKANST
jgi:DNA-binding LacI/PurR family transcriptional regulator